MKCTFPRCDLQASTRNRAAQQTCVLHQRVVIGSSDDLGDHGRHSDETDES